MSLSPRFKKWALVTTIAALNVACVADGIQAAEKTYAPGGEGDYAAHLYATKGYKPVLETSGALGGLVGVAAAYTAATAAGIASLPGIYAGEKIGKALYKPTPQNNSL